MVAPAYDARMLDYSGSPHWPAPVDLPCVGDSSFIAICLVHNPTANCVAMKKRDWSRKHAPIGALEHEISIDIPCPETEPNTTILLQTTVNFNAASPPWTTLVIVQTAVVATSSRSILVRGCSSRRWTRKRLFWVISSPI